MYYITCERRRVGGRASKLDPEEILGRKKEEKKKVFCFYVAGFSVCACV